MLEENHRNVIRRSSIVAVSAALQLPQALAARRQLWLVPGGLMLALVLAALDQNIVATALPRIVSDLGGLAHLSHGR